MKKLLAALALAAAASAQAQTWPAQPVKIVAPFPPGGPIDSLARIVAEKFRERTGQPAVVRSSRGSTARSLRS